MWSKQPPTEPGPRWLRSMPDDTRAVVGVESGGPYGADEPFKVIKFAYLVEHSISDYNTTPDEYGEWFEWWPERIFDPDAD